MTAVLTVYLFLASGCPLSESYASEVPRLEAKYGGRGVRFVRGLSGDQARALGATVTPEAVVTGRDGEVLYRGRIDDRSLRLGTRRPNGQTRADLEMALEEALSGKAVSVRETRAVGCAIGREEGRRGGSPPYHGVIAPILARHCAGCHRKGSSGPFPLTRYEEAAPRAAAIAQVTMGRLMPPWKASPGRLHFVGERRLTKGEISLLSRWASAGAPEGKEAAAPAIPEEAGLGEPDAVVEMPVRHAIAASGRDEYRCFVAPAGLGGERWVRAFAFRPGSARHVHHALVFVDSSGGARRRDAETPEPGYRCFGVPGFLPTASLGGWTPGFRPVAYPEGAGVRIGAGADLVFQIHYHATGEAGEDRSSVALYYAAGAPRRRMMDVALGSRAIAIPAGEAGYRVRDHFTLPVGVWATGVIPHAHYICKSIKAWAVLPGGKRLVLIDIPDWDFNWQQHYRYVKEVRLPEGTRIEAEFVYDNSEANPRNPSSPPKFVEWGPESTDEMAGLHLQVIPAREEDATELGQALWGKIMRELGGAIYRRQ